jgi:hypothetical protein
VGLGFLAVVTSGGFLPLAIIWLLAGMAAAVTMRALGVARRSRVLLAVFVVAACPVLVFEGGLFVLPSALTLLAAEVIAMARPQRGMPLSHSGSKL